MEVSDERGVHDKAEQDPGAPLWTVPLPVHLVLDPLALMTSRQEPPDSENRVAVHKTGGWRGFGQRAKRTGFDMLDVADMEGGVDLH